MAPHTLSPHMCTQGEPQPLFFPFFFAQEGIFMLAMILHTDHLVWLQYQTKHFAHINNLM